MKILWADKDGGKDSLVWCWGIEFKSLFSILLLNFKEGSLDVYHSHAFDCISFVLKGRLEEHMLGERGYHTHVASITPVITKKSTFHKVFGRAKSTWVITFRGAWVKNWKEYKNGKQTTLTHGRIVTNDN